MEFPQFVSAHAGDAQATQAVKRLSMQEHGEIILKPLDGMGGMGIFRVEARWR
jgi:glutathione synthase